MAKSTNLNKKSFVFVKVFLLLAIVLGFDCCAASEDINDYVATADFSHPCDDSGTLIAPDGETDPNASEFVAICNGAERFGTCDSGNDCCNGTDACSELDAWVKKDGSCDGDEACRYSGIPLIINSCKEGTGSCNTMADRNGDQDVGWVVNSCYGERSCANAAGAAGSHVGHLFYSCSGDYACEQLAGDHNGYVGDLNFSCHGDYSCYRVGYDSPVGNITSSCCSEDSCKDYCFSDEDNGDGPTCGEDLLFYEDNNMCTGNPSPVPSVAPSFLPTGLPSANGMPSVTPSALPSSIAMPSLEPSATPSFLPTPAQTAVPISVFEFPTYYPSSNPSSSIKPSSSAMPSVTTSAVPSSSAMPSVSPSATPSSSAMPSFYPTAMPSSSTMPSLSRMPTSVPSSLPSMIDNQIHTTVEEIQSDVQSLTTNVEDIQANFSTTINLLADIGEDVEFVADSTKKIESATGSIDTNVDKILNSTNVIGDIEKSVGSIEANVNEILTAMDSNGDSWITTPVVDVTVSILTRRGENALQSIYVLVTVDGAAVDADTEPELSTTIETDSGITEVAVTAAVDNFSVGKYYISFEKDEPVYWVKVAVGGVEKTVMFDFN